MSRHFFYWDSNSLEKYQKESNQLKSGQTSRLIGALCVKGLLHIHHFRLPSSKWDSRILSKTNGWDNHICRFLRPSNNHCLRMPSLIQSDVPRVDQHSFVLGELRVGRKYDDGFTKPIRKVPFTNFFFSSIKILPQISMDENSTHEIVYSQIPIKIYRFRAWQYHFHAWQYHIYAQKLHFHAWNLHAIFSFMHENVCTGWGRFPKGKCRHCTRTNVDSSQFIKGR